MWVASEARALINLEWRPSAQVVNVGDTAAIGLYAVSDDDTAQSLSALDAIVAWDTAHLELLGVTNNGPYVWLSSGFPNDAGLDGVNNTWTDGDALYQALGALGSPAMASPAGLLVTTFRFEALAETPATLVTLPESLGLFTSTRVFDGQTPGLEVQGSLGSATVTIVPEPDSLLILLGGVAALRRGRLG
jgi:hypothetical protein